MFEILLGVEGEVGDFFGEDDIVVVDEVGCVVECVDVVVLGVGFDYDV